MSNLDSIIWLSGEWKVRDAERNYLLEKPLTPEVNQRLSQLNIEMEILKNEIDKTMEEIRNEPKDETPAETSVAPERIIRVWVNDNFVDIPLEEDAIKGLSKDEIHQAAVEYVYDRIAIEVI